MIVLFRVKDINELDLTIDLESLIQQYFCIEGR